MLSASFRAFILEECSDWTIWVRSNADMGYHSGSCRVSLERGDDRCFAGSGKQMAAVFGPIVYKLRETSYFQNFCGVVLCRLARTVQLQVWWRPGICMWLLFQVSNSVLGRPALLTRFSPISRQGSENGQLPRNSFIVPSEVSFFSSKGFGC